MLKHWSGLADFHQSRFTRLVFCVVRVVTDPQLISEGSQKLASVPSGGGGGGSAPAAAAGGAAPEAEKAEEKKEEAKEESDDDMVRLLDL